MIQKPRGDWQQEPVGVSAARAAWTGGTATVRSGGHVVRGVVCAGVALLWGFVAIAAGLGGSLPTLIGVGAMALGMAWAAKRAFTRAGGATLETLPAPPSAASYAGGAPGIGAGTGPATGYAMRVDYARSALLRSAILSALLAMAGLWLWGHAHGFLRFVLLIATPSLAVLAFGSVLKLRGDALALHGDATGLTVATLWRRRTLAWGDIADVGMVGLRTYALYGLVRTSTRDTLVIRVRGGGRLSVSPRLLDLSGQPIEQIVAMMHARIARTPAQMAVAGTGLVTAPDFYPNRPVTFDADEIMARYMAERGSREQGPAPCATARLVSAPAPVPAPAPGSRPLRSFGRKAS